MPVMGSNLLCSLLAGHPRRETPEELAQGQLRQHHQVRELKSAHKMQGIIPPPKTVLTE